MDLAKIRESYQANRVLYSAHARREMMEDSFGQILELEVGSAIASGEIIEDYADDRPYPSCLVFGRSAGGRPLHAVVALDDAEGLSIIVTVYQPDPERWIDSRVRKPL